MSVLGILCYPIKSTPGLPMWMHKDSALDLNSSKRKHLWKLVRDHTSCYLLKLDICSQLPLCCTLVSWHHQEKPKENNFHSLWRGTEVRTPSIKRKPVDLPVFYGAFLQNRSKEEVLRASERSCMLCLSGKFHHYTGMIKRSILFPRQNEDISPSIFSQCREQH